ncbi:minor capsid protein [Aureimonas psammosilenae]|uniref:minor capsid protein n=1 Tax=Aureimonas psammosilenae TaxID=2495496 RepID=UPI00126128D5|nr:minor capsid protein [Aureimonas psammosilenae]
MRYDLAKMVGARPRKRLVLRPIEPPPALAAPLESEAAGIIGAIHTAIAEILLPAYEPRPAVTSDSVDSLGGALEGVREIGQRLAATVSGRLSRWAVRVEEWHRMRFIGAVKAGTGVDIVAFLTSQEALDQTQAAVRWASSLITNVAEDLLQTIDNRVWTAYAGGTPRRELGKQLSEDLGIARGRANRIAIDQTTKLASNLDQMRQQEAGIAKYEWRKSGKKHARKEHVARNGKEFRWDDPPADGHPGQAIFCGCRAMPVLDLD